jgi:predicted ABC-type ATPase
LKDIVIIGGPNGAGKTTAAQDLIPEELGLREFVNADDIARELSPSNPELAAIAAGRLMVQRMEALLRSGVSFAFEMTCAGRTYARWLRECRERNWRVTMLFLWLPTAQMAIDRVARRVREGGHNIPRDVVIKRWKSGIANMRELYLPLSDIAAIYDNSDAGRTLIAERKIDAPLVIHDAARWAMIEKTSR